MKIGFLHTLAANADTFATLLREMDPTIDARHLVDEALLTETRAAGRIMPGVRERVERAIQTLAGDGAEVVVCTCSTIGAVAEATPVPSGTVVMRIDRPMAEAAVAQGSRVLVVAAVASTLGPTLGLLEEVARAAGRALDVAQLVCTEAWSCFQRGDLPGYARQIASAIARSGAERDRDVVVLAQASMAGAAALLPDFAIPILSSPRLGMEAAVHHARARRGDPTAPR